MFHGCSYYDNDEGTKTLLVSGGWWEKRLKSTDLLVGNAEKWVPAGNLPSPRDGLRGANINNKILMTGGKDNPVYFDDILEFDPVTKEWKKRGEKMIKARAAHAVSPINFAPGLGKCF